MSEILKYKTKDGFVHQLFNEHLERLWRKANDKSRSKLKRDADLWWYNQAMGAYQDADSILRKRLEAEIEESREKVSNSK